MFVPCVYLQNLVQQLKINAGSRAVVLLACSYTRDN